eukprot:g457.t1
MNDRGESVRVVGNHSILGGGLPENGVPLFSSSQLWPEWFSKTPIRLKRGEAVEYRLAVFTGGRFSRWASSVERFVPKAKSVVVEDLVSNMSLSSSALLRTGASSGAGPSSPPKRLRLDYTPGTADSDSTVLSMSKISLSGAIASSTKQRSVRFDVGGSALDSIEETQSIVSEARRLSDARSKKRRSPRNGSRSTQHKKSFFSDENLELDGKDGVIVIAHWLPVTIRAKGGRVSSGGSSEDWDVDWDDASLSVLTEMAQSLTLRKDKSQKRASVSSGRPRSPPYKRKMRFQWVGLPRLTLADGTKVTASKRHLSDEQCDRLAHRLAIFRCIPVWSDVDVVRSHGRFCREILRPVMHNIYDVYGELPTRQWSKDDHLALYQGFTNMCNNFASAVVSCFNTGDMLWIVQNSSELLYLPTVLARKLPNATVGMFIGCPG